MPLLPIKESGMEFGPFNAENVFYIEKSRVYKDNDQSFKIAEFILISGNLKEIKIIEAKSSSPKPGKTESFDCYSSDISEKLSNTLDFYIALKLKRHHNGYDELPAIFQTVDVRNIKFKLILVINGHEEEWLPPIKDALIQKMKPFCKIWNLSSDPVIVINHEWARQFQLIK